MAQMEENLPTKCEALRSNLSTTKKQKRRERESTYENLKTLQKRHKDIFIHGIIYFITI
jgi:hypothetical protein